MTIDTVLRHRQVEVGGWSLHVVEAGDAAAPTVLLLHGWPQSAHTWRHVMELGAGAAHMIAVDLPGIGGSTGGTTDGTTHDLAEIIRSLAAAMDLTDVTLVGQDLGGMVTYACLRADLPLRRAVIMDVVVPGVDPWKQVLADPHIWHFALHAVPDLPETLVRGRQDVYFDHFFDLLSFDPATITPQARAQYVAAYNSDDALSAGFDWYRGFPADAAHNAEQSGTEVTIPVLYLRGEHEQGDLAAYVAGFQLAGLANVTSGRIEGAGHFTPEENPEATWRAIADFAGLPVRP